jgi:hypothetical protein
VTWRALLGVVLGAAVAALGAGILGEYEFTGSLPYIAGPLFGLVVGEVVVAVGKARSTVVAALAAALSFGGIVWAGWIDSGDGLEPMRGAVWTSATLGALAAFLRTVDLRRSE